MINLPNKNEVHIWKATLSEFNKLVSPYSEQLSCDEKTRAEQFRFEKDKTSFIITRALLRQLLGSYLNSLPQTLHFSYTPHGKPYLAQHALAFNLSHSQEKVLFAISCHTNMGIDIEYTQNHHNIFSIAERFFSPREYALLKNLEEAKQNAAFFNAWTRKEAFLKAIGEGLSYSLNRVEVSLSANEPACFTAIHDPLQNINEWSLHSLDIETNYAAALAIKAPIKKENILIRELT